MRKFIFLLTIILLFMLCVALLKVENRIYLMEYWIPLSKEEWLSPPKGYSGVWKRFYRNMKPKSICDYQNGIIHGKEITYFEKGHRSVCLFDHGKRLNFGFLSSQGLHNFTLIFSPGYSEPIKEVYTPDTELRTADSVLALNSILNSKYINICILLKEREVYYTLSDSRILVESVISADAIHKYISDNEIKIIMAMIKNKVKQINEIKSFDMVELSRLVSELVKEVLFIVEKLPDMSEE